MSDAGSRQGMPGSPTTKLQWKAASLRSGFGKQTNSQKNSAAAAGFGSADRDGSSRVRPCLQASSKPFHHAVSSLIFIGLVNVIQSARKALKLKVTPSAQNGIIEPAGYVRGGMPWGALFGVNIIQMLMKHFFTRVAVDMLM